MRLSLGVLIVLSGTLPACTIRRLPEPLPVSQLEIRAIQSRTYADQDVKTVLKTLVNVLQDDGFLVHYGDIELGLVDASKLVAGFEDGDAGLDLVARITGEILGATPGFATVEATANVSEFGRQAKVRINFQRRLADARGRVLRVAPVTAAKAYQEFFAKLDKGLFLQREGL